MKKKMTVILMSLVMIFMIAGCEGSNATGSAGESGRAAGQADGAAGAETETGRTGVGVSAAAGTEVAAEREGTADTASYAAAEEDEDAGSGRTRQTAAKDTTGAPAAAKPGREEKAASKGLVVIDPGHQRYANTEQEPVGPGASETKIKVSGGTSGTASGVPEYQLTLDIGLKLRDVLEREGYRVILTRETNDVDISNSERAAVANEAEADVFVRIHANGAGSSEARGAMTICQTPSNPYNGDLYAESRALSDCILNAYTARTGIAYERVWETDTMSGINWCRVPVTIVEMGYMTNSEEDLLMQDPQMQDAMAEGIAYGIDAYMAQRGE